MAAIFGLGGPIILLRTVQGTVLEGEPSTILQPFSCKVPIFVWVPYINGCGRFDQNRCLYSWASLLSMGVYFTVPDFDGLK